MKHTISSRVYLALLTAALFPSFLALGLLYHLLSAHDDLVQSHMHNLLRRKNAVMESFLSLLHDKRRLAQTRAQLIAFQAERRLQLAHSVQDAKNVLQDVLEQNDDIAEIALFSPSGAAGGRAWLDPAAPSRPLPLVRLDRPSLLKPGYLYMDHGHSTARHDIHVLLAVPPDDMSNYRTLAAGYEETEHVLQIYQGIRKYYWTFFFIALCLIVLVSYFAAHAVLKSVTRTIRNLAAATREVAAGNLDVRLEGRPRADELSTLVKDFNAMVEELAVSRKRVRYLERMGAWQEVARRLAHEIKNPLTPILLAVQQIHEKAPRDNPRYAKLVDTAVQMVRDEVADLQKLVDAFGALARLPDKQVQEISIGEFLQELVQLACLSWGENAVALDAVPPQARIRGDRMLLKRALLNILENAIHATREAEKNTPVRVQATLEKKFLLLRIVDEGAGVADPEQAFEPYFTTKPQGTGLGLSLAKKIILDHDGDIVMERRAGETSGTMVTVRLPLPG